jgi:phytoene synthase
MSALSLETNPVRRLADPTADLDACRELLRGGSRSFFVASLLLPKRVRDPASALYAFCRLADDAVDLDAGREDAPARLRERLRRAYEGRPLQIAADRALSNTVLRFGMPRELPEALIEGFEWDAEGREYEELKDLYGYAARVAGSVGAMMAVLMGAREPAMVARACDLGVAMQLSNIARDVGEDARGGRLYLPRRWMREAGIDPDAWLAQPVFDSRLATVIDRLLRAADLLYQRAGAGIAGLPSDCRPGIRTARFLYAEIGKEVARRGYDSVSSRASVSGKRKLWLIARLLVGIGLDERPVDAPPLKANRFLVDAVAGTQPPVETSYGFNGAWWDVSGRVEWLIGMLTRMAHRDREEKDPTDRSDMAQN